MLCVMCYGVLIHKHRAYSAVQISLTIATAEHLMETMPPQNLQGQAATSSTPQTLLARTSHHHNVFKTGICRSQDDNGPILGATSFLQEHFHFVFSFHEKIKGSF